MKLRFLRFVTLAFFFSISGCAQEKEEFHFDNPLALQRADPFVTKAEDGIYYFIATVPEYDRIEIRKSVTINGIKEAEPVVIWRKHDKGPMGNHIWAPELHRINGKWYIYFAAGSAEEKWKIRMYALSNESKDPTKGQWIEEGQIVSNRDDFALDATTFKLYDQRYLIWTDRASDTIENTGLYIAEMTSPTTLADKQVVISQPEYDWEIQGHRVNEGPSALIRNGKVFITFSASATDSNYAIGLLWADENADLLDSASWHKLPEPVFFSNPDLKRFGPGHNSFTVSKDGETDIMIYHARNYKEIDGEPLYDPNRNTRARVLKWTKDGMPFFGQDLSDNEMSWKEPEKAKK
ncbi:glycoside hydrolase family 43 protein [Gramella sp. AN32]|uniref:Family 43 glycosylhydrolase n=1 Tax=Christiangramia antarctica TaxID=2058158 RepID=A0ABW5XBD7_9FLAO|nr:glycoside hydrolase family 43 protein [Gramella sp. AN32]MCM4157277.1 alpha-N-arabinofuranosidase [Gramella sp. AN32]